MEKMNPQKKDWDLFWKKNNTPQWQHPSWSKRRMMDLLLPLIAKGKKVLDAGCGSGFFSKFFCDCDMPTVALDYSDKALEITHLITQGNAKILKADLRDELLAEKVGGKFDLVFSDGLLEHFTPGEQAQIMKNLASLLTEQGLLITFVPNFLSPWQLIRPLYMPGIHENPFGIKNLIKLNTQSGLRVIRYGGVNVFPFRISPEKTLGRFFGMLLYVVAKKNEQQ